MGATCQYIVLAPCVVINGFSVLQLIAERDRLNKDLETAHGAIKAIEAELDNLQAGYGRGSQRR